VLVTAGIFVFALTAGVRALGRRPQLGAEALVGATGTAYEPLTPEGHIKLHGELWRAVADRPVPDGAVVRVVGVDGLTLRVVAGDAAQGGSR
jgi:membrane-bound serine protease (ClpP class)